MKQLPNGRKRPATGQGRRSRALDVVARLVKVRPMNSGSPRFMDRFAGWYFCRADLLAGLR